MTGDLCLTSSHCGFTGFFGDNETIVPRSGEVCDGVETVFTFLGKPSSVLLLYAPLDRLVNHEDDS